MKPLAGLERARVPAFLISDYLLRTPEGAAAPPRLYLLLHGFGQTAMAPWGQLEPGLPARAAVLSPNGPFPMPRRISPSGREVPAASEGEWMMGFAWYFYNPETDQYFIDMEIGVRYLLELLGKLGLASVPTTVIGFSQGGYLAPFLGQALPCVDHVIGIGCQFLVDELSLPVRFRMDGIHGARDERVSPELAQRSHQRLVGAGMKGEFVLIPEAGHRMDAAMASEVRRLADEFT